MTQPPTNPKLLHFTNQGSGSPLLLVLATALNWQRPDELVRLVEEILSS